jgi:hemerythrin-like domain-containing protein
MTGTGSTAPKHGTPGVSRASSPPTKPGGRVRRTSADAGLGYELYRQHTLLVMLAACLRHTAEEVQFGRDRAQTELRRGLQVHRDFLVKVHYPDEDRVIEVLEPVKDPEVFDAIVECKAEHPRASVFEREASLLGENLQKGNPSAKQDLVRALRQEADRIENHLAREEEMLTSRLGRWIPEPEQAKLLTQIRAYDNQRVSAEIDLLAWAAEIGPSTD